MTTNAAISIATTPRTRAARAPHRAARTALLLAAAGLLGACGDDDTEGAADPSAARRVDPETSAATLARERAAVFFAKEQWDDARSALAPLLELDEPAPRDFVSSAQIALQQGELDEAIEAMDRATEVSPDEPSVLYTQARIAMLFGEPDQAAELFERVLERVPDDAPSKIGLAEALYDGELGEEEETVQRVRDLLEEVCALGIEDGLQWYVTAVYKRYRISIATDEPQESRDTWLQLWNFQLEQKFEAASQDQLDPGELAKVEPPAPAGTFPEASPELPTYGAPEVIASLPGAPTDFVLRDMDGDRRPDVVAIVDGAVHVVTRGPDGKGVRSAIVLDGVSGPARALDLGQRRLGDTLDVVAGAGETLTLAEQSDDLDATSWSPSPVPLPALGGEVRDLCTVDYDHDGDLDLFVVGSFGARILRNDGAGAAVDAQGEALERGAWVDATDVAGFTDAPLAWCDAEDFDGDNDVDLIAGGPGGAFLYDSLRRGEFREVGAERLGPIGLSRRPAIADLDGDARPDLFVPDAKASRLLLQRTDGTFRTTETPYVVPEGASAPVAADIDLDGSFDLVWGTQERFAAGVLGVGTATPLPFELEDPGGAASGPLFAQDVDGPRPGLPLAPELVRARGADIVARRATGGFGNAIYLKFIGQKDNRQGVGAIVEVRAKDTYTRRLLRGEAELVGVGSNDGADVVRVTWPNGATGQDLEVPIGPEFFLDNESFGEQPEILVGSCPFLYTWNGAEFVFISDVLGITPLGLPMAPGMLVPPDHDEYVLVRGDQLRPDADGDLVLQFTEELREVTYLDRARLDVVDHPVGTAVYPNERFKFPPFPEAHTHVVEKTASVRRATGSDGADWTAELQALDGRHPRPFERLGDQYLGLAEPHFLELEFDPRDLAGAEKLRLIATGWFYWSDASVNMAAARTPSVEFVPPMIQVPGPDGTWVPAGPPIGFPAGKTKTMVVDVTDVIPREDPRIRLFSTLELYWDSIEIATCDDDATVWTTSLEPRSADLWWRGFSAPVIPDRADQPLVFDWGVTAPRPRWNQHPGRYTRYGETVSLLGEVDDRYVIMGSGDTLTIRFDASQLPPVPEGFERDYLVFFDGWAKDRDPNTHEALFVEPLPFHGMSGYPYGPDESFPDTAEHRAWRAEWNTRPGRQLIVPVSPAREMEWLEESLRSVPEARPTEAAFRKR
ncbi:MAG: FG-GAP-like repeat-containing protein [Planctomycetota bacterium]